MSGLSVSKKRLSLSLFGQAPWNNQVNNKRHWVSTKWYMFPCDELGLLLGSTLHVTWVYVQEKTVQLVLPAKHKNQHIRALIRKQIRCKLIDIIINYEANSRKRSADYFWIKCKILNKNEFFECYVAIYRLRRPLNAKRFTMFLELSDVKIL